MKPRETGKDRKCVEWKHTQKEKGSCLDAVHKRVSESGFDREND